MGLLAALIGIIFFQVDDSFVGVQDRLVENTGTCLHENIYIKNGCTVFHHNEFGIWKSTLY